MSTINIIYFSGTGGTRLCAQKFAAKLEKRGITITTIELKEHVHIDIPIADKLILMYPVYFANAPLPVQEFVNKLSTVNGQYAAVISVSAGGEAGPNLACRMRINEVLADKGYNVVYEKMLLMPANCLRKPHDLVAAALLKVLPHRLDKMVDDILGGKVQRSPMDFVSYLAMQIGRIPQKLSGLFSLFFTCTDSCNSCGKCVNSCPRANIYLDKGCAKWENYCSACLNCVYICPQQAIRMRLIHDKFTVAGGYDIDKYSNLAQNVSMAEVEQIAKIYTHSAERGIRKYLSEQIYSKDKGADDMITRLATELYNAYINNEKFAIPSTQTELDEETSYSVQKEYSKLRAKQEGLAGYKAAMTNPEARAKFGVDKPLAASLYRAGVLGNGVALQRQDYANLVVETELVYFADCAIKSPFTDIAALRRCFSKLAPGIELASSNFVDGKVTGNDIICVNANSTQVIVGQAQIIGDLDVNNLIISFYRNGGLVGKGKGADALECQWQCLFWLVNKILALGYTIKPGDIFFTGALGQVLPGECGEYHADFGALGKLEFRVQ